MEDILKDLDRPLVPVVITAFVYGVFLLARLHAHNSDPSYFVVAGTDHYDVASADSSLRSIRNGPGYDGQYYYRLAIEPFSMNPVDHGIAFDGPAHRQQRILYPLLAWMLSAGNPAWVPAALILVNYAGLCVIAWFGGRLAVSAGRHALWGLAFSLYPGFIFTLSRDLTEIVASSLLLAGIFLMQRAQHGLSAICLSFAVFSRETTLILPAVLMARSALSYPQAAERRNAVLYAIPLMLYAGWRTYVHWMWAAFKDVQMLGAIGLPFSGIADLWLRAAAMPALPLVIWCVETCLLGVLVVRSVQVAGRRAELTNQKIALILYAAFAACLIRPFWIEDQAFLRISMEIFVLGSSVLLLDRSRIPQAIYLFWVIAAAFTFGWRVEW